MLFQSGGDKIFLHLYDKLKNMTAIIIICAATIILMICGILFFPAIKLGKLKVDSYWVVALLGAAIALIVCKPDFAALGSALVADTAVNPVKILVLFLSMTVLSVFLDELGFFRFLAGMALKRAKSGQKKLFFYLYVTVSVLTVFTSNDVIVLSFTPFICYFAKHAKINPMPYLAAEFVAANTWSMALVIGNPTNIYLASAYGLDFAQYVKISIIPTLFAGAASLFCLYVLFRKKLSEPMECEAEVERIQDKFQLWVGIVHLGVCTLLLAVGSYIGLEMWLVSLAAVGSLFIISAVTALVRKKKPSELTGCIKRAPYQLVPFILSMFILIEIAGQKGVTEQIGAFLGSEQQVLVYGVSSFFAANIINNIPMSVLYSSVIAGAQGVGLPAVFATIIGSNLGAYFTPVGALAGIMFSSILQRHGLKFGYAGFLKMGVCAAIPALFAALGGLYVSLLFV